MQQDEVERSELEKELEQYDRIRPEIFKIIQEFEAMVLQSFPETDGTSFNHIISAYQQHAGMSADKAEQVKWIRNAFSHNQYPDIVHFPELSGGAMAQSEGTAFYAHYFLKFLQENLVTGANSRISEDASLWRVSPHDSLLP